jgi:DNA-binding Xre family transcriptional regulator
MASREASKEGKELIRKQRKEKGWKYKDERWAIAAGKILSPNLDWDQQEKENAYIAIGESSMGRFQRGKPIRPENFNALCWALSLDPNVVAADSYPIDTLVIDTQSLKNELLIDMPKNSIFYGREIELKKIDDWLSTSSIPILNIWGAAGIGKSSLMAHWVKKQTIFPTVIWQEVDCENESPELSHRDFAERILALAIKLIPELNRTEYPYKDFNLLLYHHQILIVIVGNFDASYRRWFETISTQEYKGRIIVISESDLNIVWTESEKIKLSGLEAAEVKQLWDYHTKDQNLRFDIADTSFKELGKLYDGNPTLLNLVIDSIKNNYAGNLSKAMEETMLIPKTFKKDFLDKKFNSCSHQEQQILCAMAGVEDWVSVEDIKALTEQIIYVDDLDLLQKCSLVQVKVINDEPRYSISTLWRKYLQRNIIQNK